MADEMPTNTLHRCTACGCLWRQWIGLDGSWSLADANQRSCRSCDNSPEFLSLLDPPPTALKAENERLRAALAKAERKFEIARHNIDRWLPCPDHRDKTERGRCMMCEIERLTRLSERGERATRILEDVVSPYVGLARLALAQGDAETAKARLDAMSDKWDAALTQERA